jgi:hypothetical protein
MSMKTYIFPSKIFKMMKKVMLQSHSVTKKLSITHGVVKTLHYMSRYGIFSPFMQMYLT